MKSLGELASDLSERSGFFVFPCREVAGPHGEPVKSPYISDQHNNATRSLEQIAAWWKTWPEALIGVQTGLSDLVVIDIDVKNGKDGYEQLDGRGYELPDTFSYQTPSGGRHMLYVSRDAKKLKQAGNYLGMDGVDRQTGKSHVVFYADSSPDPEEQIAVAPAWLVEASAGSGEAYPDASPFTGSLEGASGWSASSPRGELSSRTADVLKAIEQTHHIGNEELKMLSMRVAYLSVEGHPGWPKAYESLKSKYYATSHGSDREKDVEWERLVRGAIGIAEAARAAGNTTPYVDYVAMFSHRAPVLTTADAMAEDAEIVMLTLEDLHNLPTYGWWVEGMIREASLAIIGGHGGLGKTVLTLMMSLCIASGHEFFGRPVKRGKVLYVAAEGIEDFAARIDAAAEHHRLDLGAASENIRFVETGINLSVEASMEKLKEVLKEESFDVIVLDTLSQLAAVNSENDNAEAAGVMRVALSLRRITPGSSVVFIHHANRQSGTMRGASAFRDNVDTVVAMFGDSDNFDISTDFAHMGKQRSTAPFTEGGFAIVDHGGLPVLDRATAAQRTPKGDKPDSSVGPIWEVFKDGKVHTLAEVAKRCGIAKRTVERLTEGYREIGELIPGNDEQKNVAGYRWIKIPVEQPIDESGVAE